MAGNYLVTGCAGFIGARVCELLLEEGHWVYGVDNLNNAYDPRLKLWRLKRLERWTTFRFWPVDISDREAVLRLFESSLAEPCLPSGRDVARKNLSTREEFPSQSGGVSFDAVLNLAARAGVRASLADPWVYYRTNCEGALNLLEACRRFGIRKYILASTSSLYGAHNPVPYEENTDTNRPLSPYAASKKAAETVAYTYHHLYGIDVTVLRYFTVYGPAGRPDMSIFRFIRAIAEEEPIVVYGDGTQSRDFTFVDDVARGTILALCPVGYEVINLGSDAPAVLNDVIEAIGRLLGKPVKRMSKPRHPADVPATWANITKARQILGWSPQVSLEEGLRRSVAWYLENRDFASTLELGPW